MNLYRNNVTGRTTAAVQVGNEIWVGWMLDKIKSGEIKPVNTESHLLKVGDRLVTHDDYIANDGTNLTVLTESEFDALYYKLKYTDETAKFWRIKL